MDFRVSRREADAEPKPKRCQSRRGGSVRVESAADGRVGRPRRLRFRPASARAEPEPNKNRQSASSLAAVLAARRQNWLRSARIWCQRRVSGLVGASQSPPAAASAAAGRCRTRPARSYLGRRQQHLKERQAFLLLNSAFLHCMVPGGTMGPSHNEMTA